MHGKKFNGMPLGKLQLLAAACIPMAAVQVLVLSTECMLLQSMQIVQDCTVVRGLLSLRGHTMVCRYTGNLVGQLDVLIY